MITIASHLTFGLSAVLFAGFASAQEKPAVLEPAAFLLPDPTREVYFDVATLRDLDFLAMLGGPVTGMFVAQFKDNFGYGLDELDRVRFSYLASPDSDESNLSKEPWLAVYEGSDRVGLPKHEAGRFQVSEEQIAGQTVLRRRNSWSPESEGELLYVPKPGLLVHGSAGAMTERLEGNGPRGGLGGDLLSMVVGKRVVGYIATEFDPAMLRNLPDFLSESFTEEDPMSHLAIRFHIAGEEDEEHLVARTTMRFTQGEAGPAKMEESIRAGLEQLKVDGKMRHFKKYWEAIELERNGSDVELTLDLGTMREAAGALPFLIAPLMVGRAETEPAVFEIIEEVELDAPVPAEGGKKR